MADVELSTLGPVIKTAYEGQSNTNAFTDAEQSKLAAIEAGATADQSTEEIQDAAWAAVSGGTQTLITVTYQDATNDVDFVVDNDLANYSNATSLFYGAGGTDVALADGGTGASLVDPNADRIMFWDDSAGAVTWLTAGSGLTITGTTLSAAGGGGLSNIVEDATPQLGGQLDVNGNALGDGTNELLTFTEDLSAVNHVNIENQATGGGPIISSTGDDVNVDLEFATKGSGVFNFAGNITLSGTVDGRDIATDGTKLDGIETNADVTDATNVDAAGAVMESDYDANTILAATSDNTPVTLTVAEQTLVGRITSGNIDALTATEVRTLLNVEDGATADQTDEEIQDIVGAMFSGNTETLVTVTYQDIDGTIDVVVDNDLANYSNATSGFITASSSDALTNKTGNISQWTNDSGYLTAITGQPLSDLSDVTITTIAANEILKWSGTAWINNTLAEAGIAAASHTHTLTDITDSGTLAAQNTINDSDWSGTDLSLANGGTGASLVDPDADRILFWDDSAGAVTWLTAGTGLTITGTTIDATGGGSSIILDLGDDAGNDSTALGEIATSGDTNNIFTEPTADKLLINCAQNWPTADVANALATNGVDAITEIATALKTGSDAKLVTGTAGASGTKAEWNADGDLVATTDVIKIAGKETEWIPANSMTPATTAGPSLAQIETATNKVNLDVLDFDKDTDEYAHFTIAFEKAWNLGTITFQAYWTAATGGTTGVAWGLQAVAISDNESLDAAYGTAVVVTDDAQTGAHEIYPTAESAAVTIAGTPADGDLIFFRVFRDTDDANDDLAEDARLAGIKIFYTTDAEDDT